MSRLFITLASCWLAHHIQDFSHQQAWCIVLLSMCSDVP